MINQSNPRFEITTEEGSAIFPSSVKRGFRNQFTEEAFHKNVACDILCPHCGSPNLVKDGFRHYENSDSQRFKCRDCHRSFGLKINERTKKTIIQKLRPFPSIDSLLGVPCFCCFFQSRCMTPEKCQTLNRWLEEGVN